MDPRYEVREYVTPDGVSPFGRWLLGLKDRRAKAKIHARVRRASFGNFGDHKRLKGAAGLFEMREHFGPGYRVYFTVIEGELLLLLAGSRKNDQKRAIMKARQYLADYWERRET